MKPILRDVLQGPVKSLFGGSSQKQKSRSDPKDMTPPEFTGMRPEIASQLQNLFSQGGGQTFQGQTAAPLGGNEQNLLSQLMQMTTQPSGATGAGQNFLQQLIQGGQGVGADPLASLNVDPSAIQGGVAAGQVNPFLQGAIDAAQRPLIENFQDIVAPALRAQFTNAGQQIAGQGSSPFHMAAARAQSGLANAMGDIGANLAFQDLSQRQQLQSAEFQQLRDLMVGQELSGRGQDLSARGQDMEGQLRGRQQQLEAVSTAAGIDRQQLDGVLAALEAQALPRMIEQLGIDRGLEEFRRREDQLLQAIQMAGQLASPTVANVTRQGSSTSTSPNIISSLFGGGGVFPPV